MNQIATKKEPSADDEHLELDLSFHEEGAESCGVLCPDPSPRHVSALLKLYGKPKIIEQLESSLGTRKPSHLHFQYRIGGIRGLNRNFDVLLHYRLDV